MEKEDIYIFRKAVESLQIEKVFLKKSNSELFDFDYKPNLRINFTFEVLDPILKDKRIYIDSDVNIDVVDDSNKLITVSFIYRTTFIVKEADSIEKMLANKNSLDFFKNVQIRKIIYPYIRYYFHNNLNLAGLPPFELPLLL